MTELLIAEDVEAAVILELEQRLPTAGWGAANAATTILTVDEFFRVIVVGGTEHDLVIDNPTVVVEGYAKKEVRASRRAAAAAAILSSCARTGSMGGVTCYKVQVAGRPQNYPNPAVPGWFRYQFTISADLRMAAV